MAHRNTRSVRALDALAFLAPDVQGGVGPFLVVFMSATLHWDAGRVGDVMFVSALIGLLVHMHAGRCVGRPHPVQIAVHCGSAGCYWSDTPIASH
jgi:hypothetical protein